uniref:phage tail tape measure C-terminal domain-containing protein n=1 Tax=Pseudomonas sp. p1(2021b) TaxID=2874628 RepID=UPI003D2BFF2B
MASRSLGTLTLDLIAKIGGFTGPMDKAGRETQKRMAEIKKSAERLGAAVGATFAAIPAAVAGLVASSAAAAKEISNLSSLAGLSSAEFQRYAAAASSVGIQQDKLSDIFKDTNDKVGDFLATGGGELKSFFETIAPKVGVTAEQFRRLSSAEALQLYVSSLQKANVNQAQMTFFMEAIADEATALVPLLADGGRKFKELGAAAQAAGMILDDATISSAKEFNNQLTVLGQYASSAKTALAAEFMPVLAQMSKDLVATTKEAGGLQAQMKSLANSLVETVAVVASVGDGIARAFNITAHTLVGSFDTAMYYFNTIGAAGNDILGKITFGDTSREFRTAAENMRQDALVNFGNARIAAEAIGKELEKPLAGDAIREYVANARKAAAAFAATTPGTTGNGFVGQTDAEKAAQKEVEAATKKLNQAFETTEENYRRQIALINTSTDKRKSATEVEKLAFELESGRLKGLSVEQQKRLEGLAAELDAKMKLLKADQDARKLAALQFNLDEDNRTAKEGLDMELAGAGQGDKYRERFREMLAIEQDYNKQRREMYREYKEAVLAGDPDAEANYQKETEALDKALALRLEHQRDFYAQQDEMQSDWLNGVKDAWQNFADEAQNYSAMAADATTSVLGSARGELSGFLSDVATGSADAGDALADMLTGFAKAGVDALADMAAQWLVYQSVQMMVGKSTQAMAGMGMVANAQATSFQAQLAAYASTAAIPIVGPAAAPAAAFAAATATAPMVAGVASTALGGIAHGGINNIPRESTWLLDGGERVLSPNQNRDLTQYLRNANDAGAGAGLGGGITINAPVTVQAQPGMSDEAARRQGEV